MSQTLEIKMDETGMGSLILNGVSISHLTNGFDLHNHVGELTRAEIYVLGSFEFSGPAEVTVIDRLGQKVSLEKYLKLNGKK